mgnify:CR=1 FL=1
MMPGFDGVQTLKKIRELQDGAYQDLPVIALTAKSSPSSTLMPAWASWAYGSAASSGGASAASPDGPHSSGAGTLAGASGSSGRGWGAFPGIGAEALSAQAKELELAGKRGDVDYIRANHAALSSVLTPPSSRRS